MFWGIVLKANKKYSQKTTKSFHVSQAALDPSSSSGGSNQVFVTYENNKYLVCVLENGKCHQVPLDLNFAAGEEISFQSIGNGCIHLTGYLTDLPENYDLSDDDDEEESETAEDGLEISEISKKNGNKEKSNPKKGADKAKAVKHDEDEDSDEDDDEMNFSGLAEEEDDDMDDSDEDDENDDEEQDEDDSDEASDEEVQQPKAKQIKLDKHAKKQQNGISEKTEPTKKEKKNKKEKKQGENAQKQQNSAGEKNLQGGVKIQDIVTGTGPEVKAGKKVQVYYEGRLKQNNKVFDSVKQGAGFKFNVGKGEVIKGWDIGVAGMKVGGKRRIICPPHMAYGARGMPPQIPPNSTLVFEVEVKGV